MPEPVTISLQPAALELQAGAVATCRVTIHNDLERVGQFELYVQAPDLAWTKLEADQVGVFPHDEAGTTLTLQPPQDAMPAVYPLVVHVLSQTGEALEAKADLKLKVLEPVAAPAAKEGAPLRLLPVMIGLEPAVVQVPGGGEGIVKVTILDDSDEVGQYELRVEGPEAAWVRLIPDQLGIFPHETASAELHVFPPRGTAPAVYPLVFRAISQTGEPLHSQETLGVTVLGIAPPVPTAAPAAPTEAAAAAPAVEVEYVRAASANGQMELVVDNPNTIFFAGTEHRLWLGNNTGSHLAVELLTSGLPGSWVTLTPGLLDIAPMQSATATVSISPVHEAPPGDYPFTLLIEPRDGQSESIRQDLVLEIVEQGDFKAQVIPPLVESQGGGEFEVELTHGSANSMRVRLSGSDETGGCEYIFPPGDVIIPPFGVTRRKLVVYPRNRLTGASTKMYQFTVTATAMEGPKTISKAQARFVQQEAPRPELQLRSVPPLHPGQPAFALRLLNDGDVTGRFRLTASDPEGAYSYSITPESIEVPARKASQAQLVVTPQRSQKRVGTRIVTFTVHADPDGSLATPSEVVGQFVHKQQDRPGLTLAPPTREAAHSARFTVQITNPRTDPIEVQLRLVDTGHQFHFVLNPTRLRIAARNQATALLTARTTSTLLPGEARHSRVFSLEAYVPDLPQPLSVDGALEQVPGSPYTPLFFILLTVIIVGALLALFFLYQLVHPLINAYSR